MKTREPRELILAALAAGGANTSYSPVHVQKLLFLIDKEAATSTGGPHFRFEPHGYGPFDSSVYDWLEKLAREGMVRIHESNRYPNRYRTYELTSNGYQCGAAELHRLPEPARSFMIKAARWIEPLNFEQIVAAIYRRYPEMRANSVFAR